MLKFISFGSGSSGNCYLLLTDDGGLLIDAGVGPRKLKREFVDAGLSFDIIRHILITHDHADHVKSAGVLSPKFSIPVYATELVHQGIRRNYCVKKKIPNAMAVNIETGKPFNLGPSSIVAFHVPHDSFDNVGYQISYNGINFTVMTDAGEVTEEMSRFIGQSDYLVIESNHDEGMVTNGPYPQHLKERILSDKGHLSNRACGEALAKYATPRLKHIWLCHLSGHNNTPEIAKKTVEGILADAGMTTGASLGLDVLMRTEPSKMFDLL